jgi:hypothetical protein
MKAQASKVHLKPAAAPACFPELLLALSTIAQLYPIRVIHESTQSTQLSISFEVTSPRMKPVDYQHLKADIADLSVTLEIDTDYLAANSGDDFVVYKLKMNKGR